MLKVVTAKEFTNYKFVPKTQWGNWKYKPTTYELVLNNDMYIVDLEMMNTNTAILNMISQLNHKRFREDAVADFINAIDYIFNLQGNCCGMNVNRNFDPKELCDRYNKRLWSGLDG
jgi:hypothetical protein